MKKTLDRYRGHRTFLLVCAVLLPVTVKALWVLGADYAASLEFIGDVIRDAGIALGVSKAGDAALRYSGTKQKEAAAQ